MEACCLVHRRGFRILFRRKHLLLVQSETDYAGRVADEGREDAHVAVVASMWRRRFHGDAQPSTGTGLPACPDRVRVSPSHVHRKLGVDCFSGLLEK